MRSGSQAQLTLYPVDCSLADLRAAARPLRPLGMRGAGAVCGDGTARADVAGGRSAGGLHDRPPGPRWIEPAPPYRHAAG